MAISRVLLQRCECIHHNLSNLQSVNLAFSFLNMAPDAYVQVGHATGGDNERMREQTPMHIAEHKADEAAFLALPAVNPAPNVSAASTAARSLLSPLNAAPSIPSADSRRIVASNASMPSPHAVPTAPAFAIPHPSIDTQARPQQGTVPGRAYSSKAWLSTAAHQGGSPTMHTFRLPDLTSNITVATKDAFACVNAMFSSSLAHEANAPSKPAVLAEPTVTLSTKAAFAELNQMFSSDLPHRRQHADTRQQKGLPRPGARRLIGRRVPQKGPSDQSINSRTGSFNAAAVNRAQQSQSASQQPEATASPGMYEDTCLLNNGKPEAGKVDPNSYAVYEDTKFLDNHGGAQPLATNPTGNQAAGAFQIYEDTQCLQDKAGVPAAHADQDAALGVYEDTQFVNRNARAAAECGTSSADFGIYEDTLFIHKADDADAKHQFAADQSPGGFAVCKDTQFVHKSDQGMAAASSSPGGLGIYEDTQFVDGTRSSIAKLQTAAQPSVFTVKPEEAEDKENQAGAARYHQQTAQKDDFVPATIHCRCAYTIAQPTCLQFAAPATFVVM